MHVDLYYGPMAHCESVNH